MTPEFQALRDQRPMLDLTNRNVLICNLILLYQIMVASERLLKEAIEEATGDLKDYYIAHLEEERQHEKWLAEDLASVGVSVKNMDLSWDTMELAGAQYYLIKHVGPESLLGYMFVLECFPAELDTIEQLEAIHGTALLRCIRYHSQHDPDHGRDLRKVIDRHMNKNVAYAAVYTQRKLNEIFGRLAAC